MSDDKSSSASESRIDEGAPIAGALHERKTHALGAGVFVATDHDLNSPPHGGQQICTREFVRALDTAGANLTACAYIPANGLREKLSRRLWPRPYHYMVPDRLSDHIIARSDATGARLIFLNTVVLAPVAKKLKSRRPNLTVVLLSHGLESMDYLHQIRSQRWEGDFTGVSQSQLAWLGAQLTEECKHRSHLDAVMCMSTVEEGIERWLGARAVLTVPRMLTADPLDWEPVVGRVGFVGRLDHPPNYEGLRLLLSALAPLVSADFKFRCVGLPPATAHKLSTHFPFLEYLGELSDADLRLEAATWTCAVNPLFCYARGASTKLAVLLGWSIPVLATPAAMRGYELDMASPIVARTPHELAVAVTRVASDSDERNRLKACVERILRHTTSLDDVSSRMRAFLLGLQDTDHCGESSQ